MQSVQSRIWTRFIVSISYDDNHYTTGSNYYHHYHYYYLLVCFASVGISAFYYLRTSDLKKRIFSQSIYTIDIYIYIYIYIYTDQILFSNSSHRSPKGPLKFFFFLFFSETIQFNLNFFFTLLLFLIWLGNFVLKIRNSISKKFPLIRRFSSRNLSRQ